MARLFTVRIDAVVSTDVKTGNRVTHYETDFAGFHFSRANVADVVKWVRNAAKHKYGADTQVIFLQERTDQQ